VRSVTISLADHFHGMLPSPTARATTAFAETSSNMLIAIVGTIGIRCAALAKPSAMAASVACANCPATACAPVGRPRPMSASTTHTGSLLPGRWVSAISTRCDAAIAALAATVRATKSNGFRLAFMASFLVLAAPARVLLGRQRRYSPGAGVGPSAARRRGGRSSPNWSRRSGRRRLVGPSRLAVDRLTCRLRSYPFAPLDPAEHSLSPLRRRSRRSTCCSLRSDNDHHLCARGELSSSGPYFTRVRGRRGTDPAEKFGSSAAFRPVKRWRRDD
jgi:hypothetical protein